MTKWKQESKELKLCAPWKLSCNPDRSSSLEKSHVLRFPQKSFKPQIRAGECAWRSGQVTRYLAFRERRRWESQRHMSFSRAG